MNILKDYITKPGHSRKYYRVKKEKVPGELKKFLMVNEATFILVNSLKKRHLFKRLAWSIYINITVGTVEVLKQLS
jgi:hypothetical protein